MFAIQTPSNQSSTPEKRTQSSSSSSSTACYTPNILPCRIHHDGPIENVNRYWDPVADEKDNTQTTHFRGRKLRGRCVALPDGYKGIVAIPTDKVLPSSQQKGNGSAPGNDGMDATELDEPVKILEKQATFDEFVVWGHEAVPAADDPFVKGVEEWIKFAEVMHSSTASLSESQKKS